MSEFAMLVQQRGRCKGGLTRHRQYALALPPDHTHVSLTTRLDRLETIWREFLEVDDRISLFEGQVSEYFDYEEAYLVAKTAYNEALSALDPPQIAPAAVDLNSTMSRFVEQQQTFLENMADRSARHSDIRLPRLNIPVFAGNYKDWPSFKDLFITSVHDNASLSNTHKFQYLKGLLKDEAASLVKHFQVTDRSYTDAWNKLNERYDKTKNILNSYIKMFIEQPSINQLSSSGLRRLTDSSDEVIRAIHALPASASGRDPWLIFILLAKLDPESRQLWALHSSSKPSPSFQELIEFLNLRCDALETTQINLHKRSSSNRQQSNVNVFQSESRPVLTCLYCSKDHHLIFKCFKFKSIPTSERRKFVAENNLCFNCLRNDHTLAKCSSSTTCQSCKARHHSLLHLDSSNGTSKSQITRSSNSGSASSQAKVESSSPNPSTSGINTANLNSNLCVGEAAVDADGASITSQSTYQHLLPTAVVHVKDSSGNFQPCRILLDSGSQATFISENCVQRLSLNRDHAKVKVWGVSATNAGFTRGRVNLQISSRFSKDTILMCNALILKKLTSNIPSVSLDTSNWSHIRSIQLADPHFSTSHSIDIIIGADYFFGTLSNGRIVNDAGMFLAQNTIFGWIVVCGSSNQNLDSEFTTNVSNNHVGLDTLLKRFWEIEEPSVQYKGTTEEEDYCEEHFCNNLAFSEAGKFLVRLPFRPGSPVLGNSFCSARARLLSMERKFRRDPKLHQDYCKFMSEYESLGHMTLIADSEIDIGDERCFYLPHHSVIRETSSTTKLRVVFDGSCKSTSGVSLNDTLAVGPTIQRDLLSILLSFRIHRIAFTADAEKMYRQVNVDRLDQDFQRILWREGFDGPIRHYRLTTVTYGTACAPFLATRALKQISLSIQSENPHLSKIISDDFYVDDLISGSDCIQDAISLQGHLAQSMNRHGFRLRKWTSNSVEFLRNVPENERQCSSIEIDSQANVVKILGLHWRPVDDSFSFKVSMPSQPPRSKRSILSESSKIFDPLGLLSPCTISVKIMFQQLWLENYNWDDILPDHLIQTWLEARSEFIMLENLRIPRWLHFPAEIQLHAFSDASEKAYAAVVYCRSVDFDGNCRVGLVMAKTRVSPLKQVSLPRLELCAAHLLVQTLKPIQLALNVSNEKIFAWTDSSIVLSWLSSHPRKWKNFVANRTTEIINNIPRKQWHHVGTKENPADMASRGISPSLLINNDLWWHGPPWLAENSSRWPNNNNLTVPDSADLEVRLNAFNTTSATNQSSIIAKLFDKFSSLGKILRIICYIKKFIHRICKKGHHTYFITAAEYSESINICIQWAQHDNFSIELIHLQRQQSLPLRSSISSLHPFIDKTGILRVGGRLENSSCSYETKHPAILPKHHIFSSRLIEHLHLKYLHADISLLMTIIRQKYWIIGSRDMVKKSIHKCITCLRHRQLKFSQLMADLPKPRVSSGRAFQQTGVDYAGPIKLKTHSGRSYKITKGYIVLFVCFSTKAIHLELACDLTSDAFIRALRRFTSRRGTPSDMHSDNGTNFVGAVKKIHRDIENPSAFNKPISQFITTQNISWHFIPPSSPHFGGLWEAGVKSVKTHLNKSFNHTLFTFEEYSTILSQIESILNSRPLCPVNDNDLDALTPAHFLVGAPYTSLPEKTFDDKSSSTLRKWNLMQQIHREFWKRWHREYLTTLQQRNKWKKPNHNINIGDLVIIREADLSPNKWALGRVIQLHPGADNLVRVVTLKTANGTCKRPLVKLCRLSC